MLFTFKYVLSIEFNRLKIIKISFFKLNLKKYRYLCKKNPIAFNEIVKFK